MSFLGADTDELREAGQKCQDGKETTDQVIAYLRALIAFLRAASFFSGGASAAYAQYLETVVVPWLERISAALGLFAQVLGANADAQDLASRGGTVDFGALPRYTPQVTGDSTVQPFTGTLLGDAMAGVQLLDDITDTLAEVVPPGEEAASGAAGPATAVGAPGGIDGAGAAGGTGTSGAVTAPAVAPAAAPAATGSAGAGAGRVDGVITAPPLREDGALGALGGAAGRAGCPARGSP